MKALLSLFNYNFCACASPLHSFRTFNPSLRPNYLSFAGIAHCCGQVCTSEAGLPGIHWSPPWGELRSAAPPWQLGRLNTTTGTLKLALCPISSILDVYGTPIQRPHEPGRQHCEPSLLRSLLLFLRIFAPHRLSMFCTSFSFKGGRRIHAGSPSLFVPAAFQLYRMLEEPGNTDTSTRRLHQHQYVATCLHFHRQFFEQYFGLARGSQPAPHSDREVTMETCVLGFFFGSFQMLAPLHPVTCITST